MKISIIIPSYNQGQYIERTLQSILSQKGNFEIECLVMDGGSTDETVNILKKYEDQISWVSEKDRGQSDAINKGWKRASGDIIAYLNSDDTYEPGTFQKVIDFLKNHPNKMWVYGKAHIVDEQDQEIRRWITWYKNLLLKKYSYAKLLTENFITQPAVFLRRKVIDEMGLIDENHHLVMDYEYWLRVGAKYDPGVIHKYLANLRWYPECKSGAMFYKQFREELKVAKQYAKKKGMKWPIWLHTFNYFKIISVYTLLMWLRNVSALFARKKAVA